MQLRPHALMVDTLRFKRPNSYRFVVVAKYQRQYDATAARAEHHRFYASAPWRRLRAQHLACNPECVTCGGPATIAHHIVPRGIDPSRQLDPTNIASSCAPCHNRGHKKTPPTRR